MRATLSAIAFALLGLQACAPYTPQVAVLPVPYQRQTQFELMPEIAKAPPVQQPANALPGTASPEEIEQTDALLRSCLVARIPKGMRPYKVSLANSPPGPNSFVMKMSVEKVDPGYQGPAGERYSFVAKGANAEGKMSTSTQYTMARGEAFVILDIFDPGGKKVDSVRVYGQQTPNQNASLEVRATTLCKLVVKSARDYVTWRLAGNGK